MRDSAEFIFNSVEEPRAPRSRVGKARVGKGSLVPSWGRHTHRVDTRLQRLAEQPDVAKIRHHAKAGGDPLPAGFRRRDEASRRLAAPAAAVDDRGAGGNEIWMSELPGNAERHREIGMAEKAATDAGPPADGVGVP